MNAIRTIETAARNDSRGHETSLKDMGLNNSGVKKTIERVKDNKTITPKEFSTLASVLDKNSDKIIKKIEQWQKDGKNISGFLTDQIKSKKGSSTIPLKTLFSDFQKIVSLQDTHYLSQWLGDVDNDVNTLGSYTEQIAENQNTLSETKADKDGISKTRTKRSKVM